ncbi:MAG: acylphosphatase [Acidimicrobiia bacterium]|jgi:acylphosphatase
MREVAVRGTVEGRVQGVGFRWSTVHQAKRCGVTGWVRNLIDGRVEVLVQGSEAAVAAMRRFLETGPPASRVLAVELRDVEPDPDLTGFAIR